MQVDLLTKIQRRGLELVKDLLLESLQITQIKAHRFENPQAGRGPC